MKIKLKNYCAMLLVIPLFFTSTTAMAKKVKCGKGQVSLGGECVKKRDPPDSREPCSDSGTYRGGQCVQDAEENGGCVGGMKQASGKGKGGECSETPDLKKDVTKPAITIGPGSGGYEHNPCGFIETPGCN